MDDREFFDKLYQMWVKTTRAEDRFWDYQKDTWPGLFTIRSVGPDGENSVMTIAENLFEFDADWITAVHGCFPDLMRKLHYALDEADRADFDRDSRECRIAELEAEVAELKAALAHELATVAELQSDLEGLIAG